VFAAVTDQILKTLADLSIAIFIWLARGGSLILAPSSDHPEQACGMNACLHPHHPATLNPMPLTEAEISDLQKEAAAAAQNSYSPYSHFRVGAAILLEAADSVPPNTIVTGTNVENASYRLTTCAEQAAIAAAVSRFGPAIRIRAVAIANLNSAACMPCGACRQTIAEFASPETPVFYPGATGETVATTLAQLLPAAFSLDHQP
jgi:cytidine deaminase